jgi:predicted DNA-binding transcriptional regulator YafY
MSLDKLGPVVLTLSATEASALLIAVAAAGDTMPFHEAATAAAERIVEHLNPTTRVGVEILRARIRVRDHSPVSKRTRRTLEDALQHRRVVNISYVDAAGNETRRSVDPVGFSRGSDGWYLVGWCRLRHGGRMFRFNRIVSARLTSIRAENFDLDKTLGWTPGQIRIP